MRCSAARFRQPFNQPTRWGPASSREIRKDAPATLSPTPPSAPAAAAEVIQQKPRAQPKGCRTARKSQLMSPLSYWFFHAGKRARPGHDWRLQDPPLLNPASSSHQLLFKAQGACAGGWGEETAQAWWFTWARLRLECEGNLCRWVSACCVVKGEG